MKEKNAVIGLVVLSLIFLCFFSLSADELFRIKSLVDGKVNNIHYSSRVFFSFLGAVVWFFVICYFVRSSRIGKYMTDNLGFLMVTIFIVSVLMAFSCMYVFEGYFESKGYIKCTDLNGVRTNIFFGGDYVLFLNNCPIINK